MGSSNEYSPDLFKPTNKHALGRQAASTNLARFQETHDMQSLQCCHSLTLPSPSVEIPGTGTRAGLLRNSTETDAYNAGFAVSPSSLELLESPWDAAIEGFAASPASRELLKSPCDAVDIERILIEALHSESMFLLAEAAYPQRLLAASKGICDFTGYELSTWLSRKCANLSGPKTEVTVQKRIRSCIDAGVPFEGALTNYRNPDKFDQPEFVNYLMVRPIKNPHGDITHFFSVQSDITAAVGLGDMQNFEVATLPLQCQLDLARMHIKALKAEQATLQYLLKSTSALVQSEAQARAEAEINVRNLQFQHIEAELKARTSTLEVERNAAEMKLQIKKEVLLEAKLDRLKSEIALKSAPLNWQPVTDKVSANSVSQPVGPSSVARSPLMREAWTSEWQSFNAGALLKEDNSPNLTCAAVRMDEARRFSAQKMKQGNKELGPQIALMPGSHAFVRLADERFLRVALKACPFGAACGHPQLAREQPTLFAGADSRSPLGMLIQTDCPSEIRGN